MGMRHERTGQIEVVEKLAGQAALFAAYIS